MFASIRGISHRSLSKVVEGKLAQFHMQSYADKQVKNLSGGMKRRLSLSLATLGDPRIIFLYDTRAQRCCFLFLRPLCFCLLTIRRSHSIRACVCPCVVQRRAYDGHGPGEPQPDLGGDPRAQARPNRRAHHAQHGGGR